MDWKVEKAIRSTSIVLFLLAAWLFASLPEPTELTQVTCILFVIVAAALFPDVVGYWPKKTAGSTQNKTSMEEARK